MDATTGRLAAHAIVGRSRGVQHRAAPVLARVFAVGTVLALLTGWAVSAAAHAVLLASSPEDGEDVSGGPDEIVLVFNEQIADPGTIVVTDPSGADMLDTEAVIDGRQMRLDLTGALTGDGVYEVAWRVISADDHPVSGTFTFTATDVAESAVADADAGREEADRQVAASAEPDGPDRDDAEDDEAQRDDEAQEDAADNPRDDAPADAGTGAWIVGLVIALGLVALAVGVLRARRGAGTQARNEDGNR